MKLLRKLIPTSTLLVATATSLVATSCSKSDDFWMYDMTTEIVPTIKPLNIKDNLTLDQQYDKYIEEIKSNPKIWQEDCAYTLSSTLKLGNDNRQGGGGDDVDTSSYLKFGVSEPKIGTTQYANIDGSFTEKPTFSFKVKLMFNELIQSDVGARQVFHGETIIEYNNVMMFPLVTPNNTFGLSLTGNTYGVFSDEGDLMEGLAKLNGNTANWSINVDHDYEIYEINGYDQPIQEQAIHEHDVKLTNCTDIVTWFLSHYDETGDLPFYMSLVAPLMLNVNYSYHMSEVVMAPTIEYERSFGSRLQVLPGQKEDITFNRFAAINEKLYSGFEFDTISLANDFVLKEDGGNRIITFPASSQIVIDYSTGVEWICRLEGGTLDKAYAESTGDYYPYKFQSTEVKIKIAYEVNSEFHTCFQTITIPTSYIVLTVSG